MADETAQQTQSTTTIAKKPRVKRGRPRSKSPTTALATTSSLTRTTRRMAAKGKSKTAPAPRATLLNKLVNASVVLAVFVTALAIQRIVPTENVTTPKVESLPVQAAVAAAPLTPATPMAPEASAPATPVAQSQPETPAAAPAQPCVTPAATPAPIVAQAPATTPSKKFTKYTKKLSAYSTPLTSRAEDHKTTLNSGGSEDLDSEVARQHYIATTKLAKAHAPTSAPNAPSAERSPLISPAQQ